MLLTIIAFCLLGGILSVVVASSFLLLSDGARSRALPHLVSLATGALLGAAFLGLLPHAMEGEGVEHYHHITMAVLGGILGFFLLEKMVLWRHCHSDHCEAHGPDDDHAHFAPAGSLVLIGDSVHNLVDGVLIAAAFMTDFTLGVVTTLAVATHEIPQELGDFIILLHSGFSRAKALLFNVLSSLTTVVGGVTAYFFLQEMQSLLPYVLAVAAASFIYVAVADLIPTLHKRTHFKATLQQIILISAGVVIIYLAHSSIH